VCRVELGKAKTQAALGDTQLKVYHKLLSSPGPRYQDLGTGCYAPGRPTVHHIGQARRPRLRSPPVPHPGPEPGGSASTQAARLSSRNPARLRSGCCRAPG